MQLCSRVAGAIARCSLCSASYRVKAEGAGCCGTREFVIKDDRPSRLLVLGCLVLAAWCLVAVDRAWQTPQSDTAPLRWSGVECQVGLQWALSRSVIQDSISNIQHLQTGAAGRATMPGFILIARENGCCVVRSTESCEQAEAGGSARDDSRRPIPANCGCAVLQLEALASQAGQTGPPVLRRPGC